MWGRRRVECGGEGGEGVREVRGECGGEGEERECAVADVSYLHDEAEGVRGRDGPPSYREWCVQVVVQTSRQLHLSAMLQGVCVGGGGHEAKRWSYKGCEEV